MSTSTGRKEAERNALVALSNRIRCVRAQLKRKAAEGDLAQLDARLEVRLLMVYIFSGHDFHAAVAPTRVGGSRAGGSSTCGGTWLLADTDP